MNSMRRWVSSMDACEMSRPRSQDNATVAAGRVAMPKAKTEAMAATREKVPARAVPAEGTRTVRQGRVRTRTVKDPVRRAMVRAATAKDSSKAEAVIVAAVVASAVAVPAAA